MGRVFRKARGSLTQRGRIRIDQLWEETLDYWPSRCSLSLGGDPARLSNRGVLPRFVANGS